MLLKRLLNVAVAMAALIGSCALLHRILPAPPVENVTPKLRFFAAHKDEFDTLFIGTSRIQHHISPRLFDSVTAAAGMPTHSFNFGVDGMHPPESFFVVQQLLALRPRKLKAVFFELEGVQVDWWREGAGTRRLAYWHDWKQTSLAIAKAINPRGDSAWYAQGFRAVLRHRTIALHVRLFLRQFGNVSAVSDIFINRNGDQPGWQGQLGPADDGYQPPLAPMPPDRVPRYVAKLQHETSHAWPNFVDPYADKAYREYTRKFAALGSRSFFVVTPVVTQSPLRFHPPPPGPVFSFNNAKAYPQLFDPAVRADEGHLTQTSADEFTRLLAGEFIRHSAAQ